MDPVRMRSLLNSVEIISIVVFRLGLYRDAERQLKSALRDQETVDSFLYLCKVYIRLDQPLTGIEVLLKVSLMMSFGVAQ